MRKLLQAAGIAVVLASVWYGIWSWMMAPDVARVKASIAYQYKHLRERSQTTSLEADDVYATGFPFSFQVGVKRPTLSMVDGDETYAVSIPYLTLETRDTAQGTYRVNLPASIEALYAKNGHAPEHYVVTPNAMPKFMLSATESGKQCGLLTGNACAQVAVDAPFVSYAVNFPKSIVLHMQLGSESNDAEFQMMAFSLPIYQPIPDELHGPVELFVGILREALVFKTK